jgi:hypothetical protein
MRQLEAKQNKIRMNLVKLPNSTKLSYDESPKYFFHLIKLLSDVQFASAYAAEYKIQKFREYQVLEIT